MGRKPTKTTVKMSGSGSTELVDGMPLMEYNECRMSDCLRCGRDPAEAGRGVVISMIVVDAVIEAQTVCFDCLSDEEKVEYAEVLNEDANGS